MNTYTNYIKKYGNFSHILNINIDEGLCEVEKDTIIFNIYDILNDKIIEKNILNTHIPIKWRVSNEKDLLHYYTDCCGIFSDKAVLEHTNLVLNDIRKIINKEKFNIMITKPLTKIIYLM